MKLPVALARFAASFQLFSFSGELAGRASVVRAPKTGDLCCLASDFIFKLKNRQSGIQIIPRDPDGVGLRAAGSPLLGDGWKRVTCLFKAEDHLFAPKDVVVGRFRQRDHAPAQERENGSQRLDELLVEAQ